MRSFICLALCLTASPASAEEVPWGGLAQRSDAILHAPDLAGWMIRFHAAFGSTLQRPEVAALLAGRKDFIQRFGFDPYGPPGELKNGPATLGFMRGEIVASILPGDTPSAGPAPDLSSCVERDKAQLWVAAGLPGRTVDRGVVDCMTARLSQAGPRHVLHLDQSASVRGLGLLAPFFPRTPDTTWLAAVGARAKGVVRLRTAAAARGMLGPIIGRLPDNLGPLFQAHYGDELVLVQDDPPRLLLRIREPEKARAALDALGEGWGGLRGAKPFWGAAETPPVATGHAAVQGEYLVLSSARIPTPTGAYPLSQPLADRADRALAVVDLPLAGLDLAALLKQIPAGQGSDLEPAILNALLQDVERIGVTVGLEEGRFRLRFRATGVPAADRPAAPPQPGARSGPAPGAPRPAPAGKAAGQK